MIIRHIYRAGLPALLLLLMPVAAAAQQQEDQDQAWAMELQQIHVRLQALQERALEAEDLRQQRDETTALLRAVMVEIDPEVGPALDRLEAMMDEVLEAQDAGDVQRIVALSEEAQSIQPRIARAQAQAVQREDVREQIESFQQNLRARMIQMDGDAEALLARALELEQRLRGGL
jgi:hypothetical protein